MMLKKNLEPKSAQLFWKGDVNEFVVQRNGCAISSYWVIMLA